MNYRTLALIGVRLLAIWLIVVGISALPQLAGVWHWGQQIATQANNRAAEGWMRFVSALAIVVPMLIGFLLWVFAQWLSIRVAPKGELPSPDASASMLVQGAIALAGLVIAVTSLPSLIYTTIGLTEAAVSSSISYGMTWPLLAERAMLVLLGLALVVGARRLRDWIFRLRTIGT